MTKKDYELIARVVSTITDDQTRWAVGDAFAKLLLEDNPAFDVSKFFRFCKVKR